MNGKSDLQQRLAVLLRQAERAHGEYEKSLSHRDDNWPDWYAAYIAKRLRLSVGRGPAPTGIS
jgi:hypothetical protein